MKRIGLFVIVFFCISLLLHASGPRVLFIGDSITDGNWGNACGMPKPTAERSLWDMNHIYRGISGNTLRDLEKRWEEDVIGMKPDVLSVLVGTNDVHYYLQGDKKEPFDFEGWEKCYRSLLDRSLQANPELKIVLGTPFVANVGNMRKSEDFAERDSLVRRCAAIVERIAKDYQTVFLPYNAMFDEILGTAPASQDTYWIWDGIHPTPAGHKRMADMWIKRVNL